MFFKSKVGHIKRAGVPSRPANPPARRRRRRHPPARPPARPEVVFFRKKRNSTRSRPSRYRGYYRASRHLFSPLHPFSPFTPSWILSRCCTNCACGNHICVRPASYNPPTTTVCLGCAIRSLALAYAEARRGGCGGGKCLGRAERARLLPRSLPPPPPPPPPPLPPLGRRTLAAIAMPTTLNDPHPLLLLLLPLPLSLSVCLSLSPPPRLLRSRTPALPRRRLSQLGRSGEGSRLCRTIS